MKQHWSYAINSVNSDMFYYKRTETMFLNVELITYDYRQNS
jgi:hypothetical protein